MRAMSNVDRVLDANLNRAREALRVLEDHERFVRNDPRLSAALKALRHDLAAVCRDGGFGVALVRSRESREDVGKDLHASDQAGVRGLDELVVANCKRLQEALRSLEEFGLTRSRALATSFGKLRFRAYELEKELLLPRPGDRFAHARLYVIVTRAVAARPLERVTREALEGGADAIQLREKLLPDRDYLELARRLRRITEKAGRLFLVNDRVHVALACGADGVHVGAEDLPLLEARRLLGPERLVGVTCHSLAARQAAATGGADYVSVGPVYGAATKFAHRVEERGQAAGAARLAARELPPSGLASVREAVRRIGIPVVAIGGITPENAGAVARTGVACLAVCAGVIARTDVAAAARKIRRALLRRARPRAAR
ncbi:MAG: thiamine phosphate synthase [Planctomycetes bacterium]|nr:thiamine phosphate synthase [Planctomycetota bacterium]